MKNKIVSEAEATEASNDSSMPQRQQQHSLATRVTGSSFSFESDGGMVLAVRRKERQTSHGELSVIDTPSQTLKKS